MSATILAFRVGPASAGRAIYDLLETIGDFPAPTVQAILAPGEAGHRVARTVHDRARRVADAVRGRLWSGGEVDEILERLTAAHGTLSSLLAHCQTSYLVTDVDEILERCTAIAGAVSLVEDAAAWIRLTAGREAPDASDLELPPDDAA
jgi:hypothetical protein